MTYRGRFAVDRYPSNAHTLEMSQSDRRRGVRRAAAKVVEEGVSTHEYVTPPVEPRPKTPFLNDEGKQIGTTSQARELKATEYSEEVREEAFGILALLY